LLKQQKQIRTHKSSQEAILSLLSEVQNQKTTSVPLTRLPPWIGITGSTLSTLDLKCYKAGVVQKYCLKEEAYCAWIFYSEKGNEPYWCLILALPCIEDGNSCLIVVAYEFDPKDHAVIKPHREVELPKEVLAVEIIILVKGILSLARQQNIFLFN
jgi:hypothetical protein